MRPRTESTAKTGARRCEFLGETVLKVKVPPARIENLLSPLYRGTDFSTLAETFQTVWGETVLKVKVPPVRIENSLSPLYGGTDFSTLAETFKTVWGRLS